MLFGPRHFFSVESYDQDEDKKEKEEDDDDRGEKQRSLSTVTFDGSLLLPPLVDCSSNASPCPFFCPTPDDVLESKQLERDYRVQKTFYETRLERDCQELHYPPPSRFAASPPRFFLHTLPLYPPPRTNRLLS